MTTVFRRMRDGVVALAILALALLIIAKLENGQALRFNGPFLAIDGDTLLTKGERLRLEGIDAPELGQVCARPDGIPYACGADARRALMDLVDGGGWECSGTARDRYDRLLVICRRDVDELGRLLVASGVAIADGRYLAEERMARQAGQGVWNGTFEQPADWRRARKLEEVEQVGWVRALLPRWMSNWFEE